MKHVKIFVHSQRAADLVHQLAAAGFDRVSLFDVKGVLRALDARERRYSVELGEAIVNELQIDLFCADAEVARAVRIAQDAGGTGHPGAGWIYVLPVEAAFEIGVVALGTAASDSA